MLKSLWRKLTKKRLDREKVEISQQKMSGILNQQLPTHQQMTLDGKYYVPSHESLKRAITSTVIDEAKYKSNTYDCDNFAMHFQSVLALEYGINSCGVVISYESGHAFNVLVSHKGEDGMRVYVYEPQNDAMWSPSIKRDKYVIEGQTILI